MSDPPSYEESTTVYSDEVKSKSKSDAETPQHISIREEVGLSRSQHVAALVPKLISVVRDRAKQGLSKSTFLLLPEDEAGILKGQLIGFPKDELPVVIQLEGRQNNLEFWTQQEALDQLRNRMFVAVTENVTAPEQVPREQRPVSPPPSRSSFFGRKREKLPDIKQVKSPALVEVRIDEVYFRSENDYGLYKTSRTRCLMVVVDLR